MTRTNFLRRVPLPMSGVLLVAFGALTQASDVKTSDDLVAEAKATITEISVPAASALDQDDAIVIDVREPAEFADGHVPGAINIPRGLLEFRIGRIEPFEDLSAAEQRAQPIVLYCRSGGRSALAAATLGEMGFADVKSIQGGYKAWQAAALPTEQ